MELVSDTGRVESRFSPFGTMLVTVQGWSTVSTEHTTGIEIVLNALDALLGDEAHVEARFDTFGDSPTLDA
jgi:hypothetical protein